MALDFPDHDEAMRRTLEIAERCNVQIPKGINHVPTFGVPDGLTLDDYFEQVAREGFADRHYEDDGNLSPRSIPGTVFKDPDKALAQCLSMVKDRCLTSRLGKKVTVEVETICLHGDEPTAVNVARHVRKGLEAAGCRIVTIPEMLN